MTAAGTQAHDANVVAAALAHRPVAIATDNRRHFARFAQLVVVEEIANPVSGSRAHSR